jgi:hypothetical protein
MGPNNALHRLSPQGAVDAVNAESTTRNSEIEVHTDASGIQDTATADLAHVCIASRIDKTANRATRYLRRDRQGHRGLVAVPTVVARPPVVRHEAKNHASAGQLQSLTHA